MDLKKIYTDLDSLFDTELTFLDLIDSRLVDEYYTERYNIPNHYLYLNHLDFLELFKSRDKRILFNSKNSAVDDLIRNITSEDVIKTTLGTSNNPGDIHLVINSYPYKLNSNEINDMEEFYSSHILHLGKVEVIYKEELSNAFIDKLQVMIRRDGVEWYFNRKLKDPTFRAPTLRLVTPNRLPNTDVLNKLSIDVDKVIDYITTTTMLDIRFDFVDKEIFMIKLPGDDEKTNDE